MSERVNLFGDTLSSAPVKWRCLSVPGFMPAKKIPLPIAPPPRLGTRRTKVVDSFAGGGGASNGIEEALKRLDKASLLPAGHSLIVDFAINHDDAALAMHLANHPETIHLPANVWQVSMRETLGDDFFGLLWLSPDCRDHSSAKGGPITSRGVRDLAWVLLKWLKELPDWQRPWCIFLENVTAFAKWSPLIDRADGQGLERDPERIGHTFHQFVYELSRYGYSVGWEELAACDFGDPTIRKRLKLCARRDGAKIVVPPATHAAPKSADVASGKRQPWPVAADIIDFSIDCPSIFLTKEEARAYTRRTGKRIIRPLATKTDARLAFGVKRHVIDAGDDAFVVGLAHGDSGSRRWYGLDEPLTTVHAGGKNQAVVVPHVAVFRGDSVGKPATAPLPAVTANSFIKRPGGAAPLGVVETALVPHLMTMRNSGQPTQAADKPTHTVMAGGANQFEVEATIVPSIVGVGGRMGQSPPRPVTKPWQSTTTKPDSAICAASIAPFVSRGQHGGGNRPGDVPLHTVAASDGDQNQVVAVHIAQHNNDVRRSSGVNPGRPATEPVSTLTVAGVQQGVVAASMLSLKGRDRRDGSCEEPHPAVCAGGQHAAVVTLPLVSAYYGSGDGFPLDQPLWAATTHGRFGLTHADAAPQPLSDEQWARARQVAAFLRFHGCWDGGEVVTLSIRGVVYVIVDIGMRMLTPRELARAQGFPDSYILDPIHKGKRLSETEQRHKIGNSVCRLPAAAWIEANYRPPLEWGAQAWREAAE